MLRGGGGRHSLHATFASISVKTDSRLSTLCSDPNQKRERDRESYLHRLALDVNLILVGNEHSSSP